MIPLCRVCLKTSLEYIDFDTPFYMDNIHNNEWKCNSENADKGASSITFLDCFVECTRLDLLGNDALTQCLCDACGRELRIAYEFIKKAQSSDSMLRANINRNKYEVELLDVTDDDRGSKEANDKKITKCTTGQDDENVNIFNSIIYKCAFCDASFSSNRLLNTHANQKHPDILEFRVHECQEDTNSDNIEITIMGLENDDVERLEGLKTNDLTEIENHVPTHSDSKLECLPGEVDVRFNCLSCDECFSTKCSLRMHIKEKHGVNASNLSGACQQDPANKISVKRNLRKGHCDRAQRQRRDHKSANVHGTIASRSDQFLCNICSKTFVAFGAFNAHMKYHERKMSNLKSDACTTCGKQFSTKHYLRMHMEVHKSERDLHECHECGKLYVTKTAYDNHMKLHKGDTIKCLSCDKEFSRQYELNVHMRFHTRDYPFECETCGKRFAIKGHLRSHMWRHQGLKLQCEECGKLFTSTKALQEHSFTHSEMPFPCSYCSKGYPSRQKFKVHLRSAHMKELTDEELQKVSLHSVKRPLLRKKLTLVQADSVMKEVVIKTREEINDDVQEILEML